MKKIFFNGNIRTMDESNPISNYFVVEENRIVEVGNKLDIQDHNSKDIEMIDLKGKTVLPGFIDAHLHLAMIGSNLYECDLVGVNSIDELVDRVKKYISINEIAHGEWVTGKGWNEDYFIEKRLPNTLDLDRISEDHNICLTRGCYHMCVVNSSALHSMGINKDNHLIQGGIFDVDEENIPTGICRERAMKLVYERLPEVDKDRLKKYIELASNYVLSKGITSVQTDDFMVPGVKWEDVINVYQEMSKEGSLKIRVYEQCFFPNLTAFQSLVEKGYKTSDGDDSFKIGPLKILVDGNLGTRTASMSEPYSDDHTTKGINQFSQDELDVLIRYATENRFQIAAHSIGDNASRMVVESLRKLPDELKKRDLRPNLIHFQVTNKYLIDSCRELNIVANVQPIFMNYDIHMAESRLGPVRTKESYNFKTLINEGLKIALSSDSPIEPSDTLYGIYSAVTRKDLNGLPPEGWFPDERLTVHEAIKGFTLGSAYASYDEDIKGSIEVGKLADFIILSDDLYEIDPNSIKDIKVLEVYVDGELAYAGNNV